MKNYKKLFCLFLSIVMVLGMFAGCRKDKTDETIAPTEPVVTVAPTEMPTEAPTEAPTEPATEPTEIITYVISYEVNGGKMPEDFDVIYTEVEPVELPVPTKPGFEFGGWYEDEDFSGDPVTTTEGTTGDKTYYAEWIDSEDDGDGNEGGQSGSTHTHKYTFKEEVEATCFAEGYTVYKCECGKTKKDNFVTGSHEWEDWVVVKEATSKEEGLKKRSCSICKYVESEKIAKLPEEAKPTEPKPTEPAHVHSYTSTVTKPTCTKKGYTTYKCDCGDSYTADEVAATGHAYKSETVAPTTSAQGYTQYTCKVCGHSYKDNYVDKLPEEPKPTEPKPTEPKPTEPKPTEPKPTDPVHVHSYTSTVTKPTCGASGYTTHICACGDSYTSDETAATGSHDYESTIVPPTASRRGYTLHTCKVCGHSYKDNYVDKLPETKPEDSYAPEVPDHTHAWGDWIDHADGWKYRICPECGGMDIVW